MNRPQSSLLIFLLLVCGTVIGIAGTDLILPAIPGLPRVLGGSLGEAQLVLAAYTGGAGIGLLAFGELGARFDRRNLLVGSLVGFGLVSALAGLSNSLEMLIALRVVQGAVGSAAAVFAPGVVASLYGPDRAVAKLGLLGSVESMAPAFAPILGVWLLSIGGWRASFAVLACVSLAVAVLAVWRMGPIAPTGSANRAGEYGYHRLIARYAFMRQALSHAFTLSALLVFVFGSPTVFTHSMGGTMQDFITMQLCGIACFVIASNVTGRLVKRFGGEALILWGTALAALGAVLLTVYALMGGSDLRVVGLFFLLLNAGFGLRAPPGFHAAVVESRDDDARGAAIVVLTFLCTTSIATALVAIFIEDGLLPLASASGILGMAALILCLCRPRGQSAGTS